MVFGKFGTDREERINYERMRNYRLGRAREQMVVTKDGYDLLTKFPVAEVTECWT